MSAVAIDVSKDFVFYILTIANASSELGRVLAGLMADKVGMSQGLWTKEMRLDILTGALNTMAPFTALAGIMTVVWPFAKNESQLIAIACIYGYGIFSWLAADSLHPDSPLEHTWLFSLYLSWRWETLKTRGAEWECTYPSLPLEASQVLQYQGPS